MGADEPVNGCSRGWGVTPPATDTGVAFVYVCVCVCALMRLACASVCHANLCASKYLNGCARGKSARMRLGRGRGCVLRAMGFAGAAHKYASIFGAAHNSMHARARRAA